MTAIEEDLGRDHSHPILLNFIFLCYSRECAVGMQMSNIKLMYADCHAGFKHGIYFQTAFTNTKQAKPMLRARPNLL